MKNFFSILCSLASFSAFAEASCPNVHVWYSLSNDSQFPWFVQISRIYENNILFVDENCTSLDLNQKIHIPAGQTQKVGMKVENNTGFYSTYSFMGVQAQNAQPQSHATIPRKAPACAFFVAPYGPGQMDRLDWQLNNSNCFSENYGTQIHFK